MGFAFAAASSAAKAANSVPRLSALCLSVPPCRMAHPHPHCPLWHVGLDGATAGALFDPLLLLLLLLLLFLVVVLAVVLNLLLLLLLPLLLLLLLNLNLNHHQHHQHLGLHVHRLDFHQPCVALAWAVANSPSAFLVRPQVALYGGDTERASSDRARDVASHFSSSRQHRWSA